MSVSVADGIFLLLVGYGLLFWLLLRSGRGGGGGPGDRWDKGFRP